MSADAATLRQLQAARPQRSTWLTANAGSGKTRVLTQRVARLLLTGVEPQKILCLTYTKAAASEMQNRLFATLGAWAMLPEDELRAALAAAGDEGTLSTEALAHARTLFARAIETPGGLKIQTIHAFCAAILRRFPLEACVSPDFREMDTRLARLLQREVIDALAERGSPGFLAMAETQTSDDISAWLNEVLARKEALSRPKSRDEIWAEAALPTQYDWPAHAARCLLPSDDETIRHVARLLQGGGKNDASTAAKCAAIDLGTLGPATFAALEEICVYDAKTKAPFTAKTDRVPTKAGCAILGPALTDAFHGLMRRMEEAQGRRKALVTAQRTDALMRFAADFLPEYEARKARGGWLDFDDLIARTRRLLESSEMAGWVLYRLDGGIDHILVDEAQDTSPAQWEIIKQIATEFLSGEGARADQGRTVFVVGDKKQSIYSFQGADPRAFDAAQAHFDEMLEGAEHPLQTLSLDHSFRSSPAILEVVDALFAQSGHHGLGHESHHIAFKAGLPGRVDLLDPVLDVQSEPAPWHQALDAVGEEDSNRRLATGIALRIEAMLAGERLPDNTQAAGRPVRPSDILILVQRRSTLFNELIRACKAKGIPLAGADQLNVAQELAVRDITALLRFLATPEDDLSLASALKSPLFGWDEAALFDLAHHRGSRYLWPALRAREDDHPRAVAMVQDLLARADFLRPFELIDLILTAKGGRRAFYARLGPEAEDAIDALLAQALAYEQSEPPSLSGFLTWLDAEELKVKRAIDTTADVVRVMTVHGAKGLESPIVIIPDAADRRAPQQPALLDTEDGPVWLPSAADRPAALSEYVAQRQARSEEERQRLLYVAMTRAESWLVIGVAGKENTLAKGWYAQAKAAMETFETTRIEGGLRYEPLPWPQASTGVFSAETEPEIAPLDLLAPPPPLSREVIRPSDLGGAKTLAGTDEDALATARGTALHTLLEELPMIDRTAWPEAAQRLDLPEGLEGSALLAEASALIDAPHLAHLFAADTLAEVPLTAPMAAFGDAALRGVIDRLIVKERTVLAVDFKSNRIEPSDASQIPEGLLRQMGAYAAALALIFPDHSIETAILWTGSGTLMPLTHSAVSAALQRAAGA